MRSLVIIAHNLRSSHNVGSLLRTAEGLGISRVYLTGYTPYPILAQDDRLPHLARKINKDIAKTALGAETIVDWRRADDIRTVFAELRADDYVIAGLEQTAQAIELPDFQPPARLALILGREVEGLEKEVIDQTDLQLVIPMFGQKESFNVVQAAAMAMYHCRFYK